MTDVIYIKFAIRCSPRIRCHRPDFCFLTLVYTSLVFVRATKILSLNIRLFTNYTANVRRTKTFVSF
ncbi:hypothetical protein P879_05034 [Paragonimus westermani]|uniref:Uncharacterized protein n=1 Tax=Paragonimus westermani TaxID=34504 RepID=A0A8T0D1S7_9TREM|nr:hypothetical protein P879_05034 [Paragonimus westermani]